MLKAADALWAAGFVVHVLSVRRDDWARSLDDEVRASRGWCSSVVDHAYSETPVRWAWSGARRRGATTLARAGITNRWVAANAISRVGRELVARAVAIDADLYYGGATGTLPVLEALARAGRRVAVDFEDAHSLEPLEVADELSARLLAAFEQSVTQVARFCTAAGFGVAGYYERRHGVAPIVVDNVFVPTSAPPDPSPRSGPLRLYWFGQTIGPRRGLELVITAAALAAVPLRLTLRGASAGDYLDELRRLAARSAPALDIVHESPAAPDDMVRLAAGHDVGLSLDTDDAPHRAICSPNKLFVALAAGLAVVATETPGQTRVIADVGDAAVGVPVRDPRPFAAALRRWHGDRDALDRSRWAAWDAACRRWRFDHAEQAGRIVGAVREALA
jgi:glycosyltransferase involved in cell wall biosynthesis